MSVNRLYIAAAVVMLTGCASTGASPTGHSSSTLLTAVEMAEKHADVNSVYEAVSRLRPNWLAPHGPPSSSNSASSNFPAVFVDGQAYGTVTALQNIPAYEVAAVEYYDVTQAGARFGIRAGGNGAIEVRMKTP